MIGYGGGVLNWLNKPTLVQGRQGLIGPVKEPAPPGERRAGQGPDSGTNHHQQSAVMTTTPTAVK